MRYLKKINRGFAAFLLALLGIAVYLSLTAAGQKARQGQLQQTAQAYIEELSQLELPDAAVVQAYADSQQLADQDPSEAFLHSQAVQAALTAARSALAPFYGRDSQYLEVNLQTLAFRWQDYARLSVTQPLSATIPTDSTIKVLYEDGKAVVTQNLQLRLDYELLGGQTTTNAEVAFIKDDQGQWQVYYGSLGLMDMIK
ncbi:hypothetical protein HCH52_06530 [Oscillospiraceae bacterium HV4-5-C5C]|nr:hypothetical protein [Oscillospiraceae bacterium HV4-5-C5C]